MRVAIVHYWLVRPRGGEAVLDALMTLFPQADVYTNVYRRSAMGALFKGRTAPRTTWVDRFPFSERLYPFYLPFMGAALSGLDLDGYDLVISSEAGPAKWAMPSIEGRHICYTHTPMRYLWDQRHAYRRRAPGMARPFYDTLGEDLRMRDLLSSFRVDEFVANSAFVAERIAKIYRRESTVIHPPVRIADAPPPGPPEERYLFVGRLTAYKGVREAVDACVALRRPLLVVGQGPDEAYVRRFAGRGVDWVPRLPRAELLERMARCRALLHPGVEDFGMTAVEVLATGRPVIAQARGGALDTVRHGETGVLYRGGEAGDLARAVLEFEGWEPAFRPADAVGAAKAFAPEVFSAKWRALLGLGPPASPAKSQAHPAPRLSLLDQSGSMS